MAAPDKICIRKDDTAPFGFTRHWIYTTKVQEHDIEYIRKDIVDKTIKTAEDHAYFAGQEKFREKLIEWLEGRMTKEGATEGFVGGYDLALKDVINKINSM